MGSWFQADRKWAGRRRRRGRWAARWTGHDGRRPDHEQSYDVAFDGVFAHLDSTIAALRRERLAAPDQLEELLSASAEKRRLLIRNLGRFRSWVLADLLLARAHDAWSEDPAAGEDLARLALVIVEEREAPPSEWPMVRDLEARAWSYIANARRIASDLRSAERAFSVAERLLAHGTGDPLERGRLFDLEASLSRDLRRLDEATARLDRATAAYRLAGDLGLVARALIKRATIFREAGQPERGVPLLRCAAEHIDGAREPRLLLSIRYDLVTCLNESGKPEEARAMLPGLRKMALELGHGMDLLRVRWLDGQVAAELAGRRERAAEPAPSPCCD